MKSQFSLCTLIALLVMLSGLLHADDKVKVVTTFSDFACIAKYIAGDLADVEHLSQGDQDPHFVAPKPSLAMKVKSADLLISTGCDLEMWLATLQDKARNKKVMDGAPGFVTVSPGIEILQKPENAVSRSEGDVHVLGNPHFHTSPINWIKISENILIGLKRVDAPNAAIYEANQKIFVDKVHRAFFGDQIVELFGAEQLQELFEA
jgi:ABC-type Zn uptake system ZnuABC Zn-binding protein ZnuA